MKTLGKKLKRQKHLKPLEKNGNEKKLENPEKKLESGWQSLFRSAILHQFRITSPRKIEQIAKDGVRPIWLLLNAY